MKFKGDIIITDPCYIIKDQKGEPKISDYPGLSGVTASTKFTDYTEAEIDTYKKYEADRAEWKRANPDHWSVCRYGEHMENIGINTYLTRSTEYGDWSCSTFNSDTKEVLGRFCADAGLVSVFLLEEVLAYNPEYDDHIKKPWTTTLIRNFDGDITIETIDIEREDEDDEDDINIEVRVIGKGNINFETHQTGF
jgi:hypothetical protein